MSVLQVLEETCAKIALHKNEVKQSTRQLQLLVRQHLIEGLKRVDPMFALLYQEIAYAGSFYEKLKISPPDEFDLNIVMRIPVSLSHIKITTMTSDAPYEHLRIENMRSALESNPLLTQHASIKERLLSWCDDTGSLLHVHFREWFSSLVCDYISENQDALKLLLNKHHLSVYNPQDMAVTLKTEDLSVDLVPCFEFRSPLLPPQPFRRIDHLGVWYVASNPRCPRPDVWRLSMVRQEREMLHNSGNVKPAIKLIKKLLDSLKCKKFGLGSYHVKTVAMWELQEQPDVARYSLYHIFIHLLRRLEQRLRDNAIFSFWDERLNLSARDLSACNRALLVQHVTIAANNMEHFARIRPRAVHNIILTGCAHIAEVQRKKCPVRRECSKNVSKRRVNKMNRQV